MMEMEKLGKTRTIKIFLFLIYLVLSFILIGFLYNKAMLKISDIYHVVFSNWIVFLFMFLFSFLAFILKVFRWMFVIDLLFISNRNFFLLLNLSSISLLLNQVGLSLVITDGIKGGVLTLSDRKIKNRVLMFISPYLDRLVGILAALVLSLMFYLKSFFMWMVFFILLIVLVLMVWNRGYYRFIILVFLLSFFSQIFESFSLYILIEKVLDYRIDFSKWFFAFVVGSFSSLLSAFGGLGGRAIGMNLILGEQNFKIPFMIDVIYYFLQLSCAVIGIVISMVAKYINR